MHTNHTEQFADKFGQKQGFDPATIIAIITSLVEIFKNCPKPAGELKAAVKSPTRWQRIRATGIVVDNLNMPRWLARRVADDLIKEAAAAPDETIDGVVAECCDPNKW